MKATPLFLGACAFASIAGAVGGATTNTDPIQHASIGSDMLPNRSISGQSQGAELQAVLPDHYAIVTPSGRYEVRELANRGLYAQKRFAPFQTGYQEVAYQSVSVQSPPGDATSFEAAAIEAEPLPAPLAPLDISSPREVGGPKVIDVAAALAAQG